MKPTPFTDRLGTRYPIIQAPMAGGGDTPALVAAVCEAGGLGSIGAAYLTPEQITSVCAAVRSATTRPFGINLFVPQPLPGTSFDPAGPIARVTSFYAELGLPRPEPPDWPASSFDAQLTAALDGGASLISFTLGSIPNSARDRVKARRLLLAGTATTVAEAIDLERAGVEFVIAQGSEAGGHRSTRSDVADTSRLDSALIGTFALVPQIVDAVEVPVIASGGIMDGRGIAAALALGAAAAQLGTAFLTCDEAGVPEAYKQAILDAHEDDTRITRAFSGRPARGIVNRFMTEIDPEARVDRSAMLPFPLQNALTRPLRVAAAKQGRAEFLSLWAGQGLRMARRQRAAELMTMLVAETDATLARMTALL